jgi:hypothetical protein
VVAEARRLGLPLRLVGRRRGALERLASGGDEVRVADARDVTALTDAFEGAAAVASLAGPFSEIGFGPVEAAIAAEVPYMDISAEQWFCRELYERFETAPVPLLTAFGFDYALGDLAAALAAEGRAEVEDVAVCYAVARVATSPGSRKTIARVMSRPHVVYEDGLVESRLGRTTRRFLLPQGERWGVEWGATEPLSVPRHLRVRRVRSYVKAPQIAAYAGPFGRLAAPLVRLSGHVPIEPSERRRARSRFAVVAEVDGRRATLVGRDVYRITALILARAAEAIVAGELRGTGALAAAQAFEPRPFLERLAPLLSNVRVEP